MASIARAISATICGLLQAAEAAARARAWRGGACRLVVLARRPPRHRRVRRARTAGASAGAGATCTLAGIGDRGFQHPLVRRDRVGQFLHELAELVDLGARAARWRRGCGPSRRRARSPASTMRRSSSDTWRPMSAVPRDRSAICAADVVAVARAPGDRIDHHQRGQHRDRHHGRFHAGEAEREQQATAPTEPAIKRHAERDEDGAQAPHFVTPMTCGDCGPALAPRPCSANRLQRPRADCPRAPVFAQESRRAFATGSARAPTANRAHAAAFPRRAAPGFVSGEPRFGMMKRGEWRASGRNLP